MGNSDLKMKSFYSICFLLGVSLFSGCKTVTKELDTRPPNIVLFMVDDMGWQDTSVPFWTDTTPFNTLYRTPNMERLARDGMKFTQAYATSVCSPSRISLITGMNAARHRVTNWTLYKDRLQPMERDHPTLQFPDWNVNGVSPVAGDPRAVHATTLPQLLKDAGYYTIHSGKAHFGAIGTPGEDPLNLGFDINIAGHAAGAPGSYLGMENFGNGIKNREVWAVPGLQQFHGKDIFLTEALTRETLIQLETPVEKQKPFFLYMAHYAVHTPIMGDARFIQKYQDQGLDLTEAKYASMVEGMDKSLGDLMDFLSEKNIADNTIILFMSDNGGLSAEARGGERHTHNKPLASGKGSAYEGGIREPMLVKWPGKVKPNSVSDAYLIIEDFFPTILEMAGINAPATVQKIDGQSFMPILQGNDPLTPNRPLFWHYPNEWGPSGPGIGASSTVRQGDWKLIYFHKNRHMELFNLREDIGEHADLAEPQPERTQQLARILSDHLRDVNAQMPLDKKTHQPIPLPDEVSTATR